MNKIKIIMVLGVILWGGMMTEGLCAQGHVEQAKVEKLFLTWDQIDTDAKELGKKLSAMGPWDGIIAVSRGGFVPAAIIANMLNIKNVDTVSLSSYDDEKKVQTGEMKVLRTVEPKVGKWVIIDDLVDSGNTAKKLKELFPGVLIACVYAKPKGAVFTDIFAKEMEQSTWIVFPWEPKD